MFQTAAGVTIPFSEKLEEKYHQEGKNFTCNLSFEKIPGFIKEFYSELKEPLFLAIHPDADSAEVWYLDNMTKKHLSMVLKGYGELLYQDGLSAFAIGSLKTEDELFVQKYKVLSIYASRPENLVPMLERYGLSKTDRLVTAWDMFSKEHPGAAERLEISGYTVPDIVKELKKIGMYRGESSQ